MAESKEGPRFLSETVTAGPDSSLVVPGASTHIEIPAAPKRERRKANQGTREPIDRAGLLFRYTHSNEPLLGVNKITYAHFVKTVWAMSNTNLHPRDFETFFADELARMFHPVRVKNGSGA